MAEVSIPSKPIEMTIPMIKKLIAPIALLLFAVPAFFSTAEAQSLNVGYTDHEIIIVNMPEYQSLQEELQQEYQGSQQEIQALYQDYQEQVTRYQKQQSLMTEEKRAEREQELMQTQQSLQQQAQQKDQELAQREAEMMQPLLEKVQGAIDVVAKRRGLDIVLRSQVGQQPVLLYVNDENVHDITLDVALELGLEVTETDTSAMAPATGSN